MNQVHQRGREAALNLINKSNKERKDRGGPQQSHHQQHQQQQQPYPPSPHQQKHEAMARAMKEEMAEIVTEFNVTGNKLTPISGKDIHVSAGPAPSLSSSCLNNMNTANASAHPSANAHPNANIHANVHPNGTTNVIFNVHGNSADNSKKRSAPPTLEDEEFDASDNDDSYSDDDDDDEDYDEDDDPVIGLCLHCSLPPPPSPSSRNNANNTNNNNSILSSPLPAATPTAPGIQVSCDDCHSFICSACHWCHEYQANHEIRVCDRCDAFYCKGCDEMDQCEDCGEVVCGGCGALCSCKFCGCGLCEDCATACGRCGIVLCARDAKFAVECDTCKMSYCLVCLASGTKDPCVRCGHRTSKRVEQLVHLRLKSIYKAFKQSGAALGGKGGGNGNGNGNGNNNTHSGEGGRRHGGGGGGHDTSESGDHHNPHNRSSGGHRRGDNTHSSDNNNNNSGRNMPTWIAKKNGSGSSVAMPLPASVQRYAEMHGKDLKKRPGNVNSLKGDVGAVLQVAAAAAVSASAAVASSSEEQFKHRKGSKDYYSDCSPKFNDSDFEGGSRNHTGKSNNESDQFASRTQAEADAAAAALLAELDEEKVQTEASSKAKKSKKKKRKERQAAKEKKEKEELRLKEEEQLLKTEQKKGRKISFSDSSLGNANTTIDESESPTKKKGNGKKKKKKELNLVTGKAASPLKTDKGTKQATQLEDSNDDSEDDDISRLTDTKNYVINTHEKVSDKDETEKHLSDLVSANDLDGIERLLAELKGVPGRAALRKNAKKAVKRIKEEQAARAAKIEQEQALNRLNHDLSMSADVGNNHSVNEAQTPYKAPEPLLKVVSKNNRVATPGQSARYECVMHMAPSVVGWVIGKGGQRIRDLMEESGAKVWIDQDSMGPKDMRVVYVSGNKKSIDVAVTMVKDLVAKAPVGGTTHGNTAPSCVQPLNDASSVTSTRSSLTSTPVSLVQNFTQQAPPMAEKPNLPNVANYRPLVPKSPNLDNHNSVSVPTSVPNSPSRNVSLPMPPPGILGMSEATVQNPTSPLNSKVNAQQQRTPARAVHELTCEPRFVPLLIGRRGWTVKQIQDTSGARVDIDQTVTPRRIIISGEVDQVHIAVRLVRGVLSYPHAKTEYSSTGELHEGDSDEAIIRATNSVNEEFLAGIASGAPTLNNNGYPAMSLANDERQSVASININQPHPSMIQTGTNDYNHMPMNQQPDAGMLQPQFNVRMGLDMFGRTPGSGPSQVTQQMQVPSPQVYATTNMAQPSSSPSDPRVYLPRQQSAPLPVHPSEAREYRNHPMPSDTFQYDTILPLPENLPAQPNGIAPNVASRSPFAGIGDASTRQGPNLSLGKGLHSYRFLEDPSPTHQVHHPVSTERDAVNNMFGTKVDESLLSSFNDFNFGGQESESNLGSNFFDFLSHDVSEKPTEERSFGLGGVRLDVSTDNATQINSEASPNYHDHHNNWGLQ